MLELLWLLRLLEISSLQLLKIDDLSELLLLLEKALEVFIVLLGIRLGRWSVDFGCFGSVLTKTVA